MTYKMLSISIVITLFIILAFVLLKLKSNNEYKPTDYEEEMIEYFKEVALKSEYYNRQKKIVKWDVPMQLYIYKQKSSIEQFITIKKVIGQINKLASDGFEIRLTDDILKSNAILYICEKSKIREVNPFFYKILSDTAIEEDFSGFAYAEFDLRKFTIMKTLIFIDSQDTLEEQKSTIVEEITQSIGLPNDSKKHPSSVFYENKSKDGILNTEYSKIDNDLIRILYHPKIKPGFNIEQIENAIKEILKSEDLMSSGAGVQP